MKLPLIPAHGLPGKLIVLDAAAGAGKTTQANLLVERLKQANLPVVQYHIPRYDVKPYGPLIKRLLQGDAFNLDPELFSIPFTLDRALAGTAIKEELSRGTTVVACRYGASNWAYQGAKFLSATESAEEWEMVEVFIAEQMYREYELHGVVREDLLIYLDVPWKLSEQLVKTRQLSTGEGLDAQERDSGHMERVSQVYRELVKALPYGKTVYCAEENKSLRTVEEVGEEVWGYVKSL